MKTEQNYPKKNWFVIIYAVIFFLLTESIFNNSDANSDNIFEKKEINNMVIEELFKPGTGEPIGKTLLTKGKSLILHKGENRLYPGQKDIPIFKEDTLITQSDGYLKIQLNDESVITLNPDTKLIINESIFNPEKKIRSASLEMIVGKARFLVKKLADFKSSIFKVKAKNFVCGVRGSDFIVELIGYSSDNKSVQRFRVTALDNTRLEIRDINKPEQNPIIIKDYQQIVDENGESETIANLTQEQINIITESFEILQVKDNIKEEESKDKEICTVSDICERCENGKVVLITGQPCDDGNECTENDICRAGKCIGSHRTSCEKPAQSK